VESELDALRAMAFGRMRQLEAAAPEPMSPPVAVAADVQLSDAAGKSARKAGKSGVRGR
jgi:hypothetical protein